MQVVVSKTYNYLSIAEDDWVDLDYHESRNSYLDLGQTKGFLDSPSESWGMSRSTWYSSFLSGKIIFLSNRKPFDNIQSNVSFPIKNLSHSLLSIFQ